MSQPVLMVRNQPTIDELLEHWREALGSDFEAYHGHVYRVFNLGRSLLREESGDRAGDEPGQGAEEEEQLAVACAFHDLGIWTHQTFDYLTPSESLAVDYLHDRGKPEWIQAVTLTIDLHHRVRPYKGPHERVVEALRRADLADLSFGAMSGGIDRTLAKETRKAFPNAGFHWRLVQISARWGIRHPFRPFPMMKF